MLTNSEAAPRLLFTLLALSNEGSVEGFVHHERKGSTLLCALCVPIFVNSVLRILPYSRQSRPC